MPLVRAMHCVGRAHSFVVCFVYLAVDFAGDRVMPVLVTFVSAMRRVDSIDSAGRAVPHFVGFLINIACDLGDLDAGNWLDDGAGVDKWRHRRTRWNCKSSKRNCQRRANDNLSS